MAARHRVASAVSRVESLLSAHAFVVTFLLLYALANAILFFAAATPERRLHPDGSAHAWVMPVARGAGNVLNLNAFLILLLAARATLTAARATPLNMVVPFDKAMPAGHTAVAYVLLAAAGVHVGAHVVAYSLRADWTGGFTGRVSLMVSGVGLVGVLAFIRGTSLRAVRARHFEVFYWAHAGGGVAFFVLLVLHGMHYGKPHTVNRIEWHPFTIASAPHESEMVFYIKRNGDWTAKLYDLFANAGGTAAACGGGGRGGGGGGGDSASLGGSDSSSAISFPVPGGGGGAGGSGGSDDIVVHLRGPHGSPAQHVGQFSHVVLIGGGVGATPAFAAAIAADSSGGGGNSTPRGALVRAASAGGGGGSPVADKGQTAADRRLSMAASRAAVVEELMSFARAEDEGAARVSLGDAVAVDLGGGGGGGGAGGGGGGGGGDAGARPWGTSLIGGSSTSRLAAAIGVDTDDDGKATGLGVPGGAGFGSAISPVSSQLAARVAHRGLAAADYDVADAADLDALHSVTASMLLVWLVIARFALVAFGRVFGALTPRSAGLAMYNRTGWAVADLVLAAATAVPLTVSVALEWTTLGGVARVLLAQNVRATHSDTRSLDFVWTAQTQADDSWLVSELLPLCHSGTVRLHRYITRAAAAVEPWMLDYERIPLRTNYGRPDWDEVFGGIAERSKSGTTVGIFFCGPHTMSAAVQEAARGAMTASIADATGTSTMSDSYGANVRFAFREENFS
ncbi:hypothetical protein I4F81_005103 [Pyropia yezoensis]|uniref:Uncharacterized protein n=1 Tax=Pyropia yezoensis TaxID=2788 RepID=A0ACC3BXS5_PYRYE|nr:hypothetical protein I4F81_005103 [Neopyropia yezoensis]